MKDQNSKTPTSDIAEYIEKITALYEDLFTNEEDYNSWATDFIQSLKERADKFKLTLLLSDKQKNKIDDLVIYHVPDWGIKKAIKLVDDADGPPF